MNENKFIVGIWSIIACFFYAAIWTSEDKSISENLYLTGIVATFQYLFTMLFCAFYE